jgi:hypothetical protein
VNRIHRKKNKTMNRYAYFAIGTVLSAVGFLSVAHGQIPEPVRFHAPMAFQIGKTQMAAGEYTVRNLTAGTDEGVLLIEPESGTSCVAMVERIDTPDHARAKSTMVKLEREGNAMHLTRIWVGGEDYGFRILEGKYGESTTLFRSGAPSASVN